MNNSFSRSQPESTNISNKTSHKIMLSKKRDSEGPGGTILEAKRRTSSTPEPLSEVSRTLSFPTKSIQSSTQTAQGSKLFLGMHLGILPPEIRDELYYNVLIVPSQQGSHNSAIQSAREDHQPHASSIPFLSSEQIRPRNPTDLPANLPRSFPYPLCPQFFGLRKRTGLPWLSKYHRADQSWETLIFACWGSTHMATLWRQVQSARKWQIRGCHECHLQGDGGLQVASPTSQSWASSKNLTPMQRSREELPTCAGQRGVQIHRVSGAHDSRVRNSFWFQRRLPLAYLHRYVSDDWKAGFRRDERHAKLRLEGLNRTVFQLAEALGSVNQA